MKLITERLFLKEVSVSDLDKIHALHLMPETDRYNTLGIPSSPEETLSLISSWIESGKAEPKIKYTFSVFKKDTSEFIGVFGINPGKPNRRSAEIWYKFHPQHWHKGYATESLKTILNFCFVNLALHRVEAGCAVENIASIKTLEKSGFTREGRKRKILPIRGEWVDNYFYAILEEDFKQQQEGTK